MVHSNRFTFKGACNRSHSHLPLAVSHAHFFFFVQKLLGLDNKLVGSYVFEMKFFTLSVEAQAPMVEPELTEVGELHSLTDWQVSEASEEAELDEFCSVKQHRKAGKGYTSHQKEKQKYKQTKKKRQKAHTQRHTQEKGKDERSRGLGF